MASLHSGIEMLLKIWMMYAVLRHWLPGLGLGIEDLDLRVDDLDSDSEDLTTGLPTH